MTRSIHVAPKDYADELNDSSCNIKTKGFSVSANSEAILTIDNKKQAILLDVKGGTN